MGTEPHRRAAAEDHRPRRRARGRRDPHAASRSSTGSRSARRCCTRSSRTRPAIRSAYEIAMASDRVAYMGGAVSRFGDIVADIGFRWTREGTETLYIREKVLIDARAAGIRYPISGMWGGANDDLDGLRAWLTRAARHRLLRDDDGQRRARADRQRGVHADRRRGRVLAATRPAHARGRSGRRARAATATRTRARDTRSTSRTSRPARKLLGVGARAGSRGMSVPDARPRSARARRTRSSTPTGTSSSSARCFDEEMLAYLEEMGGRAVRDRVRAATPALTDTSTVLAAHPGAARTGLEGHAVVVGLADEEHARPGHRAPPGAALRTPRRVRHRLHDPVSVDDALVPRDRTTTSSSACAAAPRTACSRNLFAPYARPHAPSARWSRCSTRSSRVAELEYAVRELGFKTAVFAGHAPAGRRSAAATRTGSTRSASTARTTTTRCGRSASSSASRRCSTARCSRTASPARRPATCTTTSAGLRPTTSRSASRCSSRASRTASPTLRVRLPRRRRGVGVQPVLRSRRPLGEAQRRRRSARSTPTCSTSTR